jgi:hypothetical protein
MRSKALSGLCLAIACELCLLGTTSFAQQSPSTTAQGPPRLGYYTRLQSQASSSPAGAPRLRSRFDPASSIASRGAASGDPLRPYGNDPPAGAAAISRPYERAPVPSPPERETPAPAVSHNYFPGARSGQSGNRNMVSHCVPGRHSLMHR